VGDGLLSRHCSQVVRRLIRNRTFRRVQGAREVILILVSQRVLVRAKVADSSAAQWPVFTVRTQPNLLWRRSTWPLNCGAQ
jgi:hypothetical protein